MQALKFSLNYQQPKDGILGITSFLLFRLLCFGRVTQKFVVKCYLVYLLVIMDKKS